MTQRSLPILAMATCSFVALIGVCTPFVSSFWPSERANAAIPRVQMPQLNPSEFVFVDEPSAMFNWPSQALFVRNPDGRLNVWRIPVIDGVHGLPDIHWWQRGQSCKRFTPDFTSGTIGCRDRSLYEWAQKNYLWNLDGKNLVGYVDDLERIDGIEVAGEYLLTKPR